MKTQQDNLQYILTLITASSMGAEGLHYSYETLQELDDDDLRALIFGILGLVVGLLDFVDDGQPGTKERILQELGLSVAQLNN